MLDTLATQGWQWVQAGGAAVWVMLPLLAFVAGVVASLFPCSVGMLPLLLAYISQHPLPLRGVAPWLASGVQAGLFVLGLSLTLVVMGLASVALGVSLQQWLRAEVWLALGLLTLAMGSATLGWWHPQWPQVLPRLPELRLGAWLTPLVLGLVYGLIATPCGSPMLVVVLATVAQASAGQTHAWGLGAISLLAYGLGQGVVLIAAAMAAGVVSHRATLAALGDKLTLLAGWVMLALGAWWSWQGLQPLWASN